MVFGPSLPASDPHASGNESTPPAPDSGRRPRPREQMATLPGDQEFERHDTIPAPPWSDDEVEELEISP
jgi:hypothetical protein